MEATSKIQELMSLFIYDHLPKHLQEISKPFCVTAVELHKSVTDSHSKAIALERLMDAKNYAVQARILSQQELCKGDNVP